MSGPADLDPEDAEIVTLARASRARIGATGTVQAVLTPDTP